MNATQQSLPVTGDDTLIVPTGCDGNFYPAGLVNFDLHDVVAQLGDNGVAVTPPLLTPQECAEAEAWFDDPERFRSTVVMQRYGFGRGTYRYFTDPLPELVTALRESLYPAMAGIANIWAERLKERSFPATLDELHEECARSGQHRPTPLLLHYETGDYACLHQDIYGDVVFPLQVAIMLNQPGADFTGGENIFVEQRPRSQSRGLVVKPTLGQAMVFPVRHRPFLGKQGYRRHPMRHGTNAVDSGRRTTLGIIFHNAR
jgi:hypothetical protein